MRVVLTSADLPTIKKIAKILRRNWNGKIGQQKALNKVAFLFGYQDYFNLNRELCDTPDLSLDIEAFKTHLIESLGSFKLTGIEIETLCNAFPIRKLSAFKPLRIYVDECSEYYTMTNREAGSDVVNTLSTLKLPRYDWWVASKNHDIHSPSVIVLDKLIPLARESISEANQSVIELQDQEKAKALFDKIVTNNFPMATVSAFEAVSDEDIKIKPFGFSILEGDNAGKPVWVIHHPDTFSLLAPVFDDRTNALKALATIAVTGELSTQSKPSIKGEVSFSGDSRIVANVKAGYIVDAVDDISSTPGTSPHHTLHKLGFEMIQYRNLDSKLFDSSVFADTQANTSDYKLAEHEMYNIPNSIDEYSDSINQKTIESLKDLQLHFKGRLRYASKRIEKELPLFLMSWIKDKIIPKDYQPPEEEYHDIAPEEMAQHVPQLSREIPSFILDDCYYWYVNYTQGCRPYGHTVGQPWEFLGYLMHQALTGTGPRRQRQNEIGAILMELCLRSDSIDEDHLNSTRLSLEKHLDQFDSRKCDISQVSYALREMKPDSGTVSHGKMRTTMADLMKMGRKWNVDPKTIESTVQ